jgi:hypothetical protein
MKTVKDMDVYAAKLIDSIPNEIVQAQYPTLDQIYVLMELARKLKMYDAYDLLDKTFFRK